MEGCFAGTSKLGSKDFPSCSPPPAVPHVALSLLCFSPPCRLGGGAKELCPPL